MSPSLNSDIAAVVLNLDQSAEALEAKVIRTDAGGLLTASAVGH